LLWFKIVSLSPGDWIYLRDCDDECVTDWRRFQLVMQFRRPQLDTTALQTGGERHGHRVAPYFTPCGFL
jgi:hypothetical protein